jgi:hypothetical protein
VTTTTRLALVAAALLPLAAGAQESAPALQEDPRAARYRDVEHGFYVGFEAGYYGLLDTPVADPARYPNAGTSGGSSGGAVVGLNLGYELGSRVALSLFGTLTTQKAGPSYGAFTLYGAGGDLRLSFLQFKDRNGTPRFFVYAHGRGGYGWTTPTGLFEGTGLFAAAGLGVEYYTRLRHFSIGLAVDYVRWFDAAVNGYAVYPTVRYTF